MTLMSPPPPPTHTHLSLRTVEVTLSNISKLYIAGKKTFWIIISDFNIWKIFEFIHHFMGDFRIFDCLEKFKPFEDGGVAYTSRDLNTPALIFN